MVMILIMLLMI